MKRQNILIIHEDNCDREKIHGIISKFDFNLFYVSDGLNGLQAVKYGNFDLVITAIELKVLGGLQLAEMIKNDEEIRHIPIVFLHHEMDFGHFCRAKELDAKAFLIKPYVNNSIIYAIKRGIGLSSLKKIYDMNMDYSECKLPEIVSVGAA
ncbi:MAG: response regulator [Bacteroidota bacterium]